MTELLGYLSDAQEKPETWLLGSSDQSAVWAAELGLPYVFADFINSHGAPIVELYQRSFQASEHHPRPRTAVAAWVICAETDEEALRLSFSLRMMTLLLYRGRPIAVPDVERAERFLREEGVPPESLPIGRRIIAGSPGKVRRQVEALAKEYGAEEVLLVNILHDHAARRRSYELVAETFAMEGREISQASSLLSL